MVQQRYRGGKMARAKGAEKVQLTKEGERKCKRRRLGKKEVGGRRGQMQVYWRVALVTRRWLNRALFSLGSLL